MSLFGGAAAAAQSRSRNLVEFKAGKMNLRGTTVSTIHILKCILSLFLGLSR